jgi:TAG lipase / steryl ester hydrolase / phospholipase A2 / LPA acyltransferase
MSNSRLYKHSNIGTKNLIELYIDSTLATIQALVKTSAQSLPAGLDTKDILEQVVYARQAFGRSALLLSGGATFGMNHIGVLKALFDAQLLPRIISGASAGSIVCAVLCTRTDEEIPDVLKGFPHGDLAVFEEINQEDGLLERLGRFLTKGAWIDIKHLIRVMKALLGDMTFQEAYNRTRRILNICVSSASIYELPRLLNYITSPNVMIWSAVAASCSVPLLFSAAHLLVKNPITGEHIPWNPTPQRWIDGSVDNDLPMTRLAEMFNVNHFIVSQVNPHVIPFLAKDDASTFCDNQTTSSGADWVFTITNLAKGEALHRMQVLADLGIFPNLVTKARSVLSQKYSGDITILPEINYSDFPRILKNPTADFMVQACMSGERATWPKLSRIRNHCAVELELDAAVQQLRARVVFSPSQVDLRRFSTANPNLTPGGGSNTRRRRVSGSNAIALSVIRGAEDDTDEDSEKMTNGLRRPRLRTAASHFGSSLARDSFPPLAPAFSRLSASASASLQSPIAPPFPASTNNPIPPYNNARLKLAPEHLDLTSEAETTEGLGGFASSDADVDSHTDESSPEPDLPSEDYLNLSFPSAQASSNHNILLTPSQASLFPTRPSATTFHPPTPGLGISGYHGSLSLYATTPPSSVVNTPAILSPELKMTASTVKGRGRANVRGSAPVAVESRKDLAGSTTVPEPSSPERRYKKLFHGTAPQIGGG